MYKSYISWQYNSIKSMVESKEAVRSYDKDLLYLLPRGKPILMVNPAYKSTLVFFEGFRTQIGAGHYLEWFKDLHENHQVNIISPIIGLQGWPFKYRNRPWTHQEDMRAALQIFDAYTAHLPEDHRIVVCSMSFGTLANLTLAAKAKRKANAYVLVSPINTGMEYKSAGKVMRWLATQTHRLQYIVPMVKRGRNPARAEAWDIVNDENNIKIWNLVAKDIINWEENLGQAVQVQKISIYMENQLIPQIQN